MNWSPNWHTRRAAGALDELSGYGVDTRYPDLGESEPTVDDARRALTQATAVLQAIRRDLEAHGFPSTSQQEQRPAQSLPEEPMRDNGQDQ